MNEIKVGIFTIAGLIFFGIIVFIIGDIRVDPQLYCEVEFPDALGIKEGEKVYLSGLRVGEVKKITYSPVEKRVYLYLEYSKETSWPETSEFTIDTMGLMGEKFVGIKPHEGHFIHLENIKYLSNDNFESVDSSEKIYKNRGLKDIYHNEEILICASEKSSVFTGRVRRINNTESFLAVCDRSFRVREFDKKALFFLARYLPGEKVAFSAQINILSREFFIDLNESAENIKINDKFDLIISSGPQGEGIKYRGIITRIPRIVYSKKSLIPFYKTLKKQTRIVAALYESNEKSLKYLEKMLTGIEKPELSIKFSGDDNLGSLSFSGRPGGYFFYGSTLVTMGDLMKTGQDVLRKVHSGIETADRLLGHFNNILEEGHLKEKFIKIAENVETGSAGIRDAAVDAKNLIGDFRKTVSSVDSAIENAGSILKSFQLNMTEITKGVNSAAKEIENLAGTGKKGLDSLLSEFKSLSWRIKNIFDKNDTVLSETLNNFKGASLGFKNIINRLDDSGLKGKKISAILDSVQSSTKSIEKFTADLTGSSNELNDPFANNANKGIKSVIKRAKDTFIKAENMIDAIEKTSFDLKTSIFYASEKNDITGDFIAEIYPGNSKNIIKLGVKNVGRQGLAHLSMGRYLDSYEKISANMGVYESRFGVGFDFNLTNSITIGIEALNPERFRYNAELNIDTGNETGFILRMRDISSELFKREFQLGLNKYF
jgi:ABC-type transporter Mla subunit MlaD